MIFSVSAISSLTSRQAAGAAPAVGTAPSRHAGAAARRAARSTARRRACRPAPGSPAGRNGGRADPGRLPDAAAVVPHAERRAAGAGSAARCRCAAAPECFSALVSASRPMRSRWCSCDASSRVRRSLDAHVRRGRGAERHLAREFGQRAGEVAALERLRPQIHDRSPRLLQAVAQHLPRHVERLLRARRRRLQRRRDRLELQRDPRQPLLERVVQLARRRASARSAPPGTAGACAVRWPRPQTTTPQPRGEDREHHPRVPQRPPRRGREHDDVVRRAEQQPERRRGPDW